MRIQPEKAIGWLGVVPISQGSAVYAVIFFSPYFSPKSVWGEKWRSKKRKTKNKRVKTKKALWDSFFKKNTKKKLSYQMFSASAFCLERERDFISPCETIFRKLLSSIIHENFSKLDLSSGAHMGNQMLPSIVAASSLLRLKKCVQEPLNGVKLLPWVGREEAVSQRVSPGFYSMSLICHDCCTAQATLTEMSLLSDGAPKNCCRTQSVFVAVFIYIYIYI